MSVGQANIWGPLHNLIGKLQKMYSFIQIWHWVSKRPANAPLKFMLGIFVQIYDTLHHKLILRTGIVPQFENDPNTELFVSVVEKPPPN